ncbi:MAG: TonB-dependent receptor [Sphingomonadaceae bacterium]|uniref:TonB-dependent receptor family protein n=1 Tax=Thermaurantiacus sp. TaxID=2820283 RepID=UPI00298EEC2E|nr:TonB-dependent receptor [Thermaurantiacus sp.]MCS6986033.1 TonB-dependent receptor [Sphingomonadaceae bacterium]MDW8414751.1 TonB-dependent receptor [Thermaurantiacus sp.]
MRNWLWCGAAAAALAITAPALAQGVGNRVTLDEIVVTARKVPSRTALSDAEARRRLEQVPGAIGFVEARGFADDFTQSLGDALLWTPGVFADTSAQRENRISIRGSGLNSTFERRGLTVLRDGVPITRASGSTEFQEFEPLTVARIEVFKGANGLRWGAASLGGAIHVVSPTGRTEPQRLGLRVEGGSFGTVRGSLQAGGQSGRGDWWVGVTALKSDGYREHSTVDSLYGFANVGLDLSDRVETRWYLTVLQDNFELAGGLSLADALANPRQAGRPVVVRPPGRPPIVLDPGPVTDDWDRNLGVLRLANRTAIDLGGATLAAGGWVAHRALDHAITRFAGIIDQKEGELGVFAELGNLGFAERRPLEWVVGAWAHAANNDARTWTNVSGRRGTLRNWSDQDSANATAYAQLDAALSARLRMVGGLQFHAARRAVDARLNAVSGRRTYRQLNPRIGVLWTPAPTVQVFANAARSFEPPSIADLTAGGAFPFAPLEPQRAWTGEVGARGQLGPLAFDLAYYRARVRDEFIDLLAPNGLNSFTTNAQGRTLHQGVEAGFDLFLERGASRGAVDVVLRQVYTFNDFRFTDDPRFGDKRLAGVPRHVLAAEARVDGAGGWYGGVNVRWVPDGPFVDYANTTQAPGYHLWGLTAGWRIDRRFMLFASVENLFDKVHISNVSTTADQSRERAPAFTPGQGRAAFGGLSVRF